MSGWGGTPRSESTPTDSGRRWGKGSPPHQLLGILGNEKRKPTMAPLEKAGRRFDGGGGDEKKGQRQ
jgi:hypothetical protein